MINKNFNSLILGRLGQYSDDPGQRSTIQGINDQLKHLRQRGGCHQQERMIKDKRRSLDRALLYSYQAAEVREVTNRSSVRRALINPNKLKQDYDDKIISCGYEAKLKTGDVFEWIGTGTYWLIYLQDLTELAYFRGDIRKCSYQIAWEDENGERHSTYAAIRGPVETKINFIQKNGISVDTPNHSLHILMPKNDDTVAYFKRYSKFYLQEDKSICWRVEATDWISTPNILEITAVEYYANEHEDDLEEGIAGGLIVEPINPNEEEVEEAIVGETFIRPKKKYQYEFTGSLISDWVIDTQLPIQAQEIEEHRIELTWMAPVSGQFNLAYGDFTKTIIVESLF